MAEPDSAQESFEPLTYVSGRTTLWNSSWRRIYEHFGYAIVAYARGKGLNDQSAHDVLQEVMVTILRCKNGNAASYDKKKGSFQGWIWGVIRNRVRSVRRQLGKEELTNPLPSDDREIERQTKSILEIAQSPPDFAEMDQEGWERAILEAAVQRVRAKAPHEKFTIFTALLAEKASPAELAQQYGETRNNIDAIKHRYKKMAIKEAKAIRAEWEQLREIKLP